MMKPRSLITIAIAVFGMFALVSEPLPGQNPSAGVIASSRTINYEGAVGLPSTLPDGETTPNPWTPPTRTTICSTVTPTVSTDIQNAVISCSNSGGGVVVITGSGSASSPDVYNLGSTSVCLSSIGYPDAVNNVTVEGNGVKLVFTGSAGVELAGCGTQYGSTTTVTNSGAIPSGTTTLDLSSAPSSFVAGKTVMILQQCATGFGGSGCTNSSGAQVDTGTSPIWVCAGDNPWCSHGGSGTGGANYQTQLVQVNSVSGSGPYTVTFTPGLYMPNWNSAQYPIATFLYPEATGVGLEGTGSGGLTIDLSGSTGNVQMMGCNSCWITGVRVLGLINLDGAFRSLVGFNYERNVPGTQGGYGITETGYNFSNNLIIGNIVDGAGAVSSDAGGSGDMWAYNFVPGSGYLFNHTGGTSFIGAEGNVASSYIDDNIHGNHDFSTLWRNYFTGGPATEMPGTVDIGQGSRVENVVGNIVTGRSSYQNSFGSAAGALYYLGVGAVLGVQGIPYDKIAYDSLMRWGNYDTVHNAWQWNSAEVPSALDDSVGYQEQIGTGNGTTTAFSGTITHTPCISGMGWAYDSADKYYGIDNGSGTYVTGTGYGSVSYGTVAGTINCTTGAVSVTQIESSTGTAPASGSPIWVNYLYQTSTPSVFTNPLPSSHTLADSLFIPITGYYPNGGTGLSWWKVCTDFPTCSQSYTPAFPPIGPDVSGGPELAGSYPIPAEEAMDTLPVDPSYQVSYAVTGISVTGTGPYTVTVSVSGTPNFSPFGRFTVSGASPSSFDGTYYMTANTSGSVSYSSATNPGTYTSGGNVLYPDIPYFAPAVYEADPAFHGYRGIGARGLLLAEDRRTDAERTRRHECY